MIHSSEEAWTSWQQQISAFLRVHGLLPTPTTEGMDIPFDVASDCWMAADTHPDNLPSLCRLRSATGTVAERAAVLLFLEYLNNDEPYLRLPEPEESERRAAVQRLYLEAVSSLPADQIDSAWRVRWELLLAAKAEAWDRIPALTQRWITLAPGEESHALATFARITFLSLHPGRANDWVCDWWCDYEGSQYTAVGEVVTSLLAAKLDSRGRLDSLEWSLPRTMTTEQFARLLDAENAIAKVHDSESNLSPMLRLVGAWFIAVAAVRSHNTERTLEAARRYARLARDRQLPQLLFETESDTARRLPAWSAAMLFRFAGDLDAALDMAAFWTEVDQKSADAWKFRAEIERQLGIESWAESYEHYVQLSPDTDNSWEHSEMLRLLLESRDRGAADRALRALALEHPDRPAVEEMLTWDWATYSQLHETTREMWWDGLVFICDERVRKSFRRTPWRYAAACFGEAVAMELRARVFGPLVTSTELERQLMSTREAGIATAILNSKATLGTMVEALALAHDDSSQLGQLINSFLNRKHKPLRAYFRSSKSVMRLKTATEFRNEAVHGDITSDEAKHVYAEARAFLDMLVKEDPRTNNQ